MFSMMGYITLYQYNYFGKLSEIKHGIKFPFN